MTQGQYTYFKAGLITVYFLTRMINLDADIPLGWGLVQYQQFDEFFYSLPAVNLFHYGTWDVGLFGFAFIDAEQHFSISVWQPVTYLFLEIFENKLAAIRFPAVLAGAGIYFFYLGILGRLNFGGAGSGARGTLFLILFAIYPLADLAFFISNTVSEPTIYRLFFASWLLYLFAGSDEISRRKAFWIGALAAFSVVFVYLYNLFLPLFAFIVLAQRPYRQTLPSFAAGGLVVVLAWVGLFDWLHNVPLSQTYSTVMGNNMREVASFRPMDLVKRVALVFSTTFLSFSPALLILFVLGLLGLPILNATKGREPTAYRVLALSWIYVLSYLLQGVFLSDYFQRKGLMLYLPALISSYLFLSVFCTKTAREDVGRKWLPVAALVLGAGLLTYSFFLSGLLEYFGFFSIEMWVPLTKNAYFVACAIFVISLIALVGGTTARFRKWVASAILGVTLTFNAHLLAIHGFLHRSHTFLETISAIGKLAPGFFVGYFSHAFTAGDARHKPFFYLYTLKFMKVPDRGSGLDALLVVVIDKFLERAGVPVYTVVQGGSERDRFLKHYPDAEVVYSNPDYRDVESYVDHRVSVPSEMERREIHVLRMNPTRAAATNLK